MKVLEVKAILENLRKVIVHILHTAIMFVKLRITQVAIKISMAYK